MKVIICVLNMIYVPNIKSFYFSAHMQIFLILQLFGMDFIIFTQVDAVRPVLQGMLGQLSHQEFQNKDLILQLSWFCQFYR